MKNITHFNIKKQSGQTLVEFVLLLAGIMIISVSFLSQINGYTAKRWETIANIILDDPDQKLQVR